MTKKFQNTERISDVELDRVSGGTVEEMWDLTKRIMDVNPGFLGRFGSIASRVADVLQNKTGVGKISGPINRLIAKCVSDYLKCDGITADISIGFAGTGAFDRPNRYSYNGQRITHAKAMSLIQPV